MKWPDEHNLAHADIVLEPDTYLLIIGPSLSMKLWCDADGKTGFVAYAMGGHRWRGTNRLDIGGNSEPDDSGT